MDNAEDSAVADFLQILEEHRKNCERQGKYVEAEIAKNRLEELKLHEENRRKEAMRSRQIAERLGVEEAHMLEFQQFNMVWDKKMTEYERHAEELVEAMKERHAAELRDFQSNLLQKQQRPKFSRELLNLRKIPEIAAEPKRVELDLDSEDAMLYICLNGRIDLVDPVTGSERTLGQQQQQQQQQQQRRRHQWQERQQH